MLIAFRYLNAICQSLMIASQYRNAEEPLKKRRSEEELWRETYRIHPSCRRSYYDQSQHDIYSIRSSFLSNGNGDATTSVQELEEELCMHAARSRRVEG